MSFGARIGESAVLLATQHEVAVDFVAEHNHAVALGHSCYLGKSGGIPSYAYRVVRVAENHHSRMLFGKYLLQLLEIHTVRTIGGFHEVVAHHQSAITH